MSVSAIVQTDVPSRLHIVGAKGEKVLQFLPSNQRALEDLRSIESIC